MQKVNADASEMLDFAVRLENSTGELSSILGQLASGLSGLSDTWQDRKFEEFREEFNTLIGHLDRFVASSEDYSIYLRRASEHLTEFTSLRIPSAR